MFRSSLSNNRRLFLIVLVTIGASFPVAWSCAEDRVAAVGAKELALVDQLGDESYTVRERAAAELLRRGFDSVPALEKGVKHIDREVRYRSERLLIMMRDREQDQKLEAFLHRYDPKRSYSFPGWERYRQQFGDASPARALFADMFVAEPDLLAATDRGSKAITETLAARGALLQQMLQAVQFGQGGQELSIGSIATLLFAASDEKSDIQPAFGMTMSQFLQHATFANAITSNGHKEILRRLLTSWFGRKEDWLLHYNLPLAMKYESKEALALAERGLRGPATNSYVRQLAILMIVKFRDETRMPLVERCLDDKTVYTNWQPANNVMVQSQVRDIALAALLLVHKQDPKEFGFDRLQLDPQMVLQAYSAGFENEEKRAAAFAKWEEFRAAQKKNGG